MLKLTLDTEPSSPSTGRLLAPSISVSPSISTVPAVKLNVLENAPVPAATPTTMPVISTSKFPKLPAPPNVATALPFIETNELFEVVKPG